MFVEFSESPDGSLIGGGGTTDQLGFPLSPPAPTSFWIWFYLSVFCNLLCLGLNTVFSAVSIIERHRTFRNCFYTIVLAFSLSVVVGSLCNLVYQILSLAGVQSKGFEIFSISMDLVVSFYSALLVFFLGLNRFAAFSSTILRERLMEKKVVLCVLLGLLVFSSMIAVLVLEMSGMRRVSHQNTIYATKYILVTSHIFYTLPIISSVFYLFAYKSLRSKREDAVSDVTKSLLNRAERCNLKQGVSILITYLVTSHIFYTLPIISSVFYLFAYKSLRSKREDAVSDVTKSLLNRAERCNLKQGVSILITYLVCSFLYAEAYYAGRIILVMRDFLSKAEVTASCSCMLS
ncbi:hypothetical protein COOONC_11182 [Cooperia oncophora]